MQQVGQRAFAAGLCQQACRQLLIHDELPHRRQHALAVPQFPVTNEVLNRLIQDGFINTQAFDLRVIQTQQRCPQCGPDQAAILR